MVSSDNVYCLIKIIKKDERITVAVQFEIKLFDFFYRSKQLTDYIFIQTCTVNCQNAFGQTPCSYEHYLVIISSSTSENSRHMLSYTTE